MRVCTHGLYPYKMGVWVPAKDLTLSTVFEIYIDLCERVNLSLPAKERTRPEASTPAKFNDEFMNNGFRIISCGKFITAIYKHDFRYTLICAETAKFNVAWKEHYSGNPRRIANY